MGERWRTTYERGFGGQWVAETRRVDPDEDMRGCVHGCAFLLLLFPAIWVIGAVGRFYNRYLSESLDLPAITFFESTPIEPIPAPTTIDVGTSADHGKVIHEDSQTFSDGLPN
jgi:hypothetical protein